MSGIAEILKHWGYTVTGSDLADSPTLQRLNSHGIKSTVGHDLDSLRQSDLVVYSAAISSTDIEMLEAQKHPENYRQLVVRIWGWSAYFVELDKEYQDHVIARQAYTV